MTETWQREAWHDKRRAQRTACKNCKKRDKQSGANTQESVLSMFFIFLFLHDFLCFSTVRVVETIPSKQSLHWLPAVMQHVQAVPV